jgi:octaprenyl-diphosphate synthase
VGDYLFQKSGKRIRPALIVLCCKLLGYTGKDHILMSTLVENIHTASLIHDDMIDNSELRRGRETVHSRWGPNITVLLGDYLYIKSLNHSIRSTSPEITQILTDISSQMIEGELMEYRLSWNLDIQEEEYLDILDKKTAVLFAGSCRLGGIVSNAEEKEIQLLDDFGSNLGMSFQLIDDLLDYTGEEKVLGKPVLSDINEGRITLPLIHTLNNKNQNNRKRIIELLKERQLQESAREEFLHIIKSNGALDYTRNKAQEYSIKAKDIINYFPESIYRDTLAMISDFIVQRNI